MAHGRADHHHVIRTTARAHSRRLIERHAGTGVGAHSISRKQIRATRKGPGCDRGRSRQADQFSFLCQRRWPVPEIADAGSPRNGVKWCAPGPSIQCLVPRHQHAPLSRRRGRVEKDHGRRPASLHGRRARTTQRYAKEAWKGDARSCSCGMPVKYRLFAGGRHGRRADRAVDRGRDRAAGAEAAAGSALCRRVHGNCSRATSFVPKE